MLLRFFRCVTVLAALTLWSAASAHCSLEAVGILPVAPTDAECCLPLEGCSDDSCEIVESADYSAPSLNPKLPPPQLIAAFAFGFAHAEHAFLAGEEPVDPEIISVDWQPGWVPSWHFSRRTAPPPRAPDHLA